VAVARQSADDIDNRVRVMYFRFCSMASCFHIMGQIVKRAAGELFIVTRQVAPGAKSALADWLVAWLSNPASELPYHVFYRASYASAVLGVVIMSVCPSVRLCVTRVLCD